MNSCSLWLIAAVAAAASYPRGQMLVEPAALAGGGAGTIVLLDARDKKAFDESRIPAARWVDAAAWTKQFVDGQDPEGWARRIGELGIVPGATVVVYDDSAFKDAARVWWVLRYWGVEDVRLLNGGWTGWKAARLPVETAKPRPVAAAAFKVSAHGERLATKRQLLDALPGRALQIVDARSSAEFCGIEKQKNKRGGAIPGARHLDWTDLVDKATKRFKPADVLQRLFADAGIDPARPTATYCQSGGRASVMTFALELMGAPRVANYYASWAEWGNADDTPVFAPPATKPPPGK